MPYDMINTDSEFYEHNFYGLRKHFIKPRFCYCIIYSKIRLYTQTVADSTLYRIV